MRCAPLLICLLYLLPQGRAAAYPYLALRPVGDVATGPTDADLSSLHFNPAALRLLNGFHVQVSASALGYLGSYDRTDPLPAGFSGPGSPSQSAPSLPIRWVAPGSLVGASWNLGSDSVTLALGFYTPFVDETSYGGDPAKNPARYFALSQRTYSLWGAVGIAFRVTSWFFLGGGFNFAWTRTELDAYRDAGSPNPRSDDSLPCGTTDPAQRPCEQWQNRQEVQLDVNRWGYGFTAGLLFIPLEDRLWLGLSYVSALFTDGGAQVALSGYPDLLSQMPQPVNPALCPSPWRGALVTDSRPGAQPPTCGDAQLIVPFPHLIYLGARTRIGGGSGRQGRPHHYEVASFLRLTIPPNNDYSLQLEQRAFPLLPQLQVLPLAPRTAVAVDVDVREIWRGLVLAQGLIYESPRTDPQAMSPANLDGHKLDLSLSARIRVQRHLWLTAAAGVTYYLLPDGAGQGFSPAWAAQCRTQGYDVTSEACQRVQAGWALPPAAGQYTLAVVHGSAGLNVNF